MASLITVLICTHNRVDLLRRALASLNAARPAGWQVEIWWLPMRVPTVRMNCSTPTTRAMRRPLRVFSWTGSPNLGQANRLPSTPPYHAFSGDMVTFVDDDHRVDENYLMEICRAAEDYPYATMFCGRILPEWDGTEPHWVHDEGPYRIRPLPIPRTTVASPAQIDVRRCDPRRRQPIPRGVPLIDARESADRSWSARP